MVIHQEIFHSLNLLKFKSQFTKRRNCAATLKNTLNVLEKYKSNLLVTDITVDFLNEFERERMKNKISPATISGNLRDLRCIINFFKHKEPLLPDNYQYPFGKGGYSIKSSFSTKKVLSAGEINRILNFSCDNDDLIGCSCAISLYASN